MGLPFVLVHGALLWKLSLVVVTGGAVAGVSLLRRIIARRALRHEVRELDARKDSGLVRGTLGGGEAVSIAACKRFDSHASADFRGDELWIETADGKVRIDGPLRVVAGSQAAAARNRTPATTPDALVAKLGAEVVTATLARVVPGDEVIALGSLETVAGDSETDARTNAGMRVLRPIGDAPITIVARTPKSAVPRMPIVGLAVLVALVSLISWRIEKALGEHWREACWEHYDYDEHVSEPVTLSNTNACVLAAATPGSREDALDRLVSITEQTSYHDRAMLDQQIAIGKLAGDCEALIRVLQRSERYEEVIDAARDCGDRRAEHNALVALGRFEEAVALPVAEHDDGSLAALPMTPTLILAGKWNEAAAAVDRYATEVRNRKHEHDEDRSYALTVLSYQCLAELLRHHGGDAAALGRLRTLAAGPEGGVCTPELAEAVPDAERTAVLAREDDPLMNSDIVLGRMRAFAGGKGGFESTSAESVLAQPDEMGPAHAGATIWMAATTALPADAPPYQRAMAERWQTVAATLGGDYAAAREHAAHAIAARPMVDERFQYELRDTTLLPSLIALYAGGDVAYTIPPETRESYRDVWLHDFGRLLLRHGAPLEKDAYFGPDSEYLRALDQAEHGDGTALAQRMAARTSWWYDTDIMAVLPRITTGRDAVIRELAWTAPHDELRLEFNFPWSVALHAAARRASLQFAGETAEAARWQTIYQRYDKALRDRKKLIALALWDL